MGRFITGGFPVVRIGNRMFRYVKEMGLILGFDSSLSELGFVNVGITYRRNIKEEEIESAYYVYNTLGVYLDYKVSIRGYNEDTKEVLIGLSYEDGCAAGFKPKRDPFDGKYVYFEEYVPEKDLREIYEIRQPEGDFVFESPRIVFHKRNGQWLPRHEFGALLKDDEWL